jgi:DHA1 family tetracycline resistance protein-like MFS transporter
LSTSKQPKAALIFIFITILVDVIGMGIIIPIIPGLIKDLTGQGLGEASRLGGWLMFSYAIMQFVFSPILGGLSDQFGRRPVLIISLIGLGVDYFIHALAPTLLWLFIGRVLAGIAGASITTATAYIADISSPEKRAQNFGLIGAAFGLGFIIGPVIGGIFSQWGIRVPFYVAAGLTLLNALYGFFVIPESLSEENRRPFSWKRANPVGTLLQLKKYPLIIGFLGTIFLLNIASHAVQSNWSFYSMLKFGWDEKMVGYSLGFVGLLVALVQGGLIRVLVPKIGQKRAVIIGLSLHALGMLLFGMATQGWMMFAILIPFALGGIAGPTIQGIISNQVHDNEQGELQGGITSLISFTTIIGPPLMTGLFAFSTSESSPIYLPGAPFYLASFLCFIGLVLIIRTLSKQTLKS